VHYSRIRGDMIEAHTIIDVIWTTVGVPLDCLYHRGTIHIMAFVHLTWMLVEFVFIALL